MKKILSILLLLTLTLSIAGCSESWRKKFVRKKKEAPKAPRIYQLKKYEKTPSPELYKKHYSYWASWHSELLADLGENQKKDKRCIEEILGNLDDMRQILVPEKAAELQKHIDKLTKVKDTIFNEELTQANRVYVSGTLDREERAIKREFVYKKVKDHLKKSFDEEP